MILDDIGVIVIGRNEGARLIACIASATAVTNSLVYVDSGSTDGSAAAAEALGAFVVNLDLTRPFTAGRARNEGFAALKARKSHIRFVQFVDGDCTLAPDWIEAAFAFIEERDDIAVVCGRLRERYPSASVYNRLCDFEWDTAIGETSFCGGNALMRAAAFEAVGGFNPQLIAGEEPELCLRLRERGWKIWRIDAEMGLHDAAMMRFTQWWLRSVRWGYALAEVSQLHRTSPLAIWRRERVSTIFWGALLPTIICLGTLLHPAALGALLAYLVKLWRAAVAWGPASSRSWTRAGFATLANFAACQGMLKFYWRKCRGLAPSWIEYK
jgi:GT2 family glycosyltransferase